MAEPVIARIRKGGMLFELSVYPKEAIAFRKGRGELNDALIGEDIYLDALKGKKASDVDLKKAFRTENRAEAAKIILREGEIQLPKAMRDEMIDRKKRQIAGIISKTGINPQTGAPHPPERILGVMEKLGINVDFYPSAEDQVQRVLEKVRVEIPISVESARFEIRVPASHASAAYGKVKALGKILRESWNGDGSYSCMLEVPAGQKNEVYDVLGRLTHGEAQITEAK